MSDQKPEFYQIDLSTAIDGDLRRYGWEFSYGWYDRVLKDGDPKRNELKVQFIASSPPREGVLDNLVSDFLAGFTRHYLRQQGSSVVIARMIGEGYLYRFEFHNIVEIHPT
ncbi:MAG: hypothetical protein ABIP54_04075 [Candidatus Andersenbacteria bacterium]